VKRDLNLKFNLMKYQMDILLRTIIIIVVAIIVFSPMQTNAQIPFGGKIVSVIPCTCNWMLGNPAVLINHVPVAGYPQLIFQLGFSRLYAYYSLVPGSWILGNTLGFSTCWVGVIPFCVPAAPAAPLISIVGPSLPGL